MNDDKKGKIFFCEKPAQAKDILKALGKNGDVSIICPATRGYTFNYPKRIQYNSIPATNLKPEYNMELPFYAYFGFVFQKINDVIEKIEIKVLTDLHLAYKKINEYNELSQSEFHNVSREARIYILSFEEIISACDNDLTGARGFSFYFEKYLDLNYNIPHENVTYLEFSSFDKKSLDKTFINRKNIKKNKRYQCFIESYKKKDFFEYNFNVNSLVLFGELLRKTGFFSEFILTKNLLITLLLIEKEKKIKMSEHRILDEMHKLMVGNCATRIDILKKLYDTGLIWYGLYKHNGKEKKCILLTDECNDLLSIIHPKIKDVKMSYNSMKDVRDSLVSVEEFKEKYSKKMEVMFNKQKNLSRKLNRDEILQEED